MSCVTKKHMTRLGLEPRTYHILHVYSGPLAKPVNSTILYSFQGLWSSSLSGKMWIQKPINGFNFVTLLHFLNLKVQTSSRTLGCF